jgi:hypothetical protein
LLLFWTIPRRGCLEKFRRKSEKNGILLFENLFAPKIFFIKPACLRMMPMAGVI